MSTWTSFPHLNWPAKTSFNRLVIAAASARPFVRAAVAAGYQVTAADVFCDEDTRRFALHAIPLGYRQGGFDGGEVRSRLLPLLREPGVAFVYGSGFETQPELLDEISRCCPVLGNDAATVAAIKHPATFFAALDDFDIPYPPVSMQLPPTVAGWLGKRIGGSGGTHVAEAADLDPHAHYFQQKITGRPYSLLFLADGRDAIAVGYNEQWLAPIAGMPFRYGGAVSQALLPDQVRQEMLAAARVLASRFGLRGLNSLDGLVDGSRWWALEVNPRLSATFASYAAATDGAALFEAHLQACQGRLEYHPAPEKACAHLIYYAPNDCVIPPGLEWPEWVADLPAPASHIQSGDPVCTIRASARDAAEAAEVARRRADRLTDILTN